MNATNEYYGVKVEKADGSIIYFGKKLNDFIGFNINSSKANIKNSNGCEFHCAHLDQKLIEKYGYKTQEACKKVLLKYGWCFGSPTTDKFSIVKLDPSLEAKENWTATSDSFNKIFS